MVRIVNGEMVPTDGVLAGEAAEEVVAYHREITRNANRSEAGARISALFGGKTDMSLVVTQMNMQARVSEIVNAKADGAATAEELAELAVYHGIFSQIKAIRMAENTASAALDAAGTDTNMTPGERTAEINAVPVTWP